MAKPQKGKAIKKGKKNRKFGRNKTYCAYYKAHRSEKNRVRRIKRHIKAQPNDLMAKKMV